MTRPHRRHERRRRQRLARRFARTYQELGPDILAADEDWSLEHPHTPLFLGTYSAAGLRAVCDRYGLTRQLAERGVDRFDIEIDTEDPFRHVARLRMRTGAGDDLDGALLFELRCRVAFGRDLGLRGRLASGSLLVVEWLHMQDPRRRFEGDRIPLPGQRHPGMGLGAEVEQLLVLAARRLGCGGLVSWPQWVHNAILYRPRWKFVDPAEEGRLTALLRDLGHLGLARLSWAVHLGCVRDAEGRVVEWRPGPLVLPRLRTVATWFETPRYRATRFAARALARFSVDEERLDLALAEEGIVSAPPRQRAAWSSSSTAAPAKSPSRARAR